MSSKPIIIAVKLSAVADILDNVAFSAEGTEWEDRIRDLRCLIEDIKEDVTEKI